MTTMTTDAPFATGAQVLPEALRALIDARLDTIERMLLGRVARPDRLAIVRDVEGQIHEMMAGRCVGDSAPDRGDVLAVLADLDPPEAYLPEEGEGLQSGQGRLRVRLVAPTRDLALAPARPSPDGSNKLGLWAGALGLVALGFVLLVPVIYALAILTESEIILFVGGLATILVLLIASVLAVVLACVSRLKGAWPIIGLVTGLLGLFVGITIPGGYLVLLLMG